MQLLLNASYKDAYDKIVQLQIQNGIALDDCITELHALLLRSSLPDSALKYLLDKLSDIEHRLAFGTTNQLELQSLIGSFILARELITNA